MIQMVIKDGRAVQVLNNGLNTEQARQNIVQLVCIVCSNEAVS